MAELSLHRSHPVFDLEETIVHAGNQPCPVELKPWQDRIDKITGKTTNDLSRLRIVWGQDFERAGMWIAGRMRLKYPFWRYEEGGQIHDIGIPRFYVEELIPRWKIAATWERGRYGYDEETGKTIDVAGPLPDDGFYVCCFSIGVHDEVCCNGSGMQSKDLCLGAYRPPCDTDITRIRRMVWNRNNATPTERDPSTLQLEKQAEEMAAARDERNRQASRGYIDDYCRTHAWKWFEMGQKRLDWGKFVFVRDGAHSKSGATPEELQQWRTGAATVVANGSTFTVIDRRRIKETEDVGSSDSTRDAA